ncbi:hypothetical protein D9613_001935 [Agrocybe pediades]|uniref:Uncharacterized protein n=1 Tax=Agrocybe pediades TaxID=84607 RepID=A0A8H4R4F0_9AGAR|nr:hypothetical protein D9613_001935 [Agrocybe pediades]
MLEHAPPPTYSQQDPVAHPSNTPHAHNLPDPNPQILIIPTADAVNFQKGYLGAEEERAAIEGELQIKGADPERWGRVTVSLRSYESAFHHDIELSFVEVELYSKTTSDGPFPSSLPFAIPLLPDTPQSIQTPHSILGHTLTATIHPLNESTPKLAKSLTVHTRRYSSHASTLTSSPEIHELQDPTRVTVQVPRDTFTSGEAIPLYVVVPPPSRETVVEKGLRLRNIRAELVRVVKVKRESLEDGDVDNADSDGEMATDGGLDVQPSSSTHLDATDSRDPQASSSKMPRSPLFLGSSYRFVVARSGASCRFHSSRPIQLRFVLHQNSAGSPSDSRTNLDRMDSDIESPLITQSTLLHSVTFHIKVHVSFVDTSTQSEKVSTLVIPVNILPPPAPLPEVSRALDDEYQKKHDRPPARTVREEEVDPSIPHYSEGEAGPSMLSAGAPPPFEERDAPPPFFMSSFEAASSSRLPTFQESEREVILPESSDLMQEVPLLRTIPGEGVIFGFSSDEQFDGHSDDMQRSSTPPPTLEMASRDTDLTALTDQPTHVAIEALSMVLDQQREEGTLIEEHPDPPPPPPAMDDPSDPPPSIDSDFRSPAVVARQSSPTRASPPLRPSYRQNDPPNIASLPTGENREAHASAPPPYLNPAGDREPETDNDQVTRPPPYVD